jgi:hypothetical protein
LCINNGLVPVTAIMILIYQFPNLGFNRLAKMP